jgi:hypothetical protein
VLIRREGPSDVDRKEGAEFILFSRKRVYGLAPTTRLPTDQHWEPSRNVRYRKL